MSAYREKLYPRSASIELSSGKRIPVRVLGENRNGSLIVEVERDVTIWDRFLGHLRTGPSHLRRGMQLALPKNHVHFDRRSR